jgi:hypothetical protein
MSFIKLPLVLLLSLVISCAAIEKTASTWILIDNFEFADTESRWFKFDAQNDTKPHIPNPQITHIVSEKDFNNHYLLKKPAADGVIGNRKALSYIKLPVQIGIGETYTLYARFNIEYFPNNHSFGLSNLTPENINTKSYDAFEPMIRITDKVESNGYKNDGTLMVLNDYKSYSKIINPQTTMPAQPLQTDTWYEIWVVVNNASKTAGGQSYDLHVNGGEFKNQQAVYKNATFRMNRVLPLSYFITISNTGSKKQPYGNGGVRYDDLYMARGMVLSSPLSFD